MPIYEKIDFYTQYRKYARIPGTRARLARFKGPQFEGLPDYDPDIGVTLPLHYHPKVIKPYRYQRMPDMPPERLTLAERVVAHLDGLGTPLTASDRVAIIGGAWNWLGEALEDLIPGLETCSIDLSNYIQTEKDASPDNELVEVIQGQGMVESSGVGLALFNMFTDPNPRCRDGSKVVQADISTNQGRNKVRQALRNTDPTLVITEEVWQVMSQQEKDEANAASAQWGVPLLHIIDGVII